MGRILDPATQKLAIKLGDGQLAELLVKAGFRTPASIRAASDKKLKAVDGIGPASVRAIRARLPRR